MESTNTYAEQVRAAKPEKHKSKWVPADTPSLIKFIGLTFIMGVLKKAQIKDYLTTTPELATPFFGHVMKRDRFVVLLRYLNFGQQTPAARPTTSRQTRSRQIGVDQAPPVSAKSKIMWVLEHFNAVARSLYNTQQNLCVDESMVKQKGHSDHVAYMPAKPCRWGLKVWVLAESVTGKCMPFHFLFQSDGHDMTTWRDMI